MLAKIGLCENTQVWVELKKRLRKLGKKPETDPMLSLELMTQIRHELGIHDEEAPVIRGF